MSAIYIRRSRHRGYWTLPYLAAIDGALRAVVRDEGADRPSRLAAMGILTSWGIALDPYIYPFAASCCCQAMRRQGGRA